MPSARAASSWPCGTICRPPRTFSARYAALNSVSPIIMRTVRSMSDNSDQKNGTISFAMKRIVISGTPRITSMSSVHVHLMTGRSLRRPSASATPSGNDAVIPTNVSRIVSSSPPHTDDGTIGSVLLPCTP